VAAIAPAATAPARRQARPEPARRPQPGRSAAAPVARPSRRAVRRPRLGRGVLWIATVGALLAGIVALNVAVLRLHLASGDVADEITKIRAENAELVAQLSSATAVGRIDSIGRMKLGLVDADHPTYLRLPPRDRKPR
jgi:hypothetical protein